jgi:hypothetical protein
LSHQPDRLKCQKRSPTKGFQLAIGKRNKPKQQPLWVATSDLAPRSGVTAYLADQGDTAGIQETLDTISENLATLGDEVPELLCVGTDKGYHQAELIEGVNIDQGITTYIPERETKRRCRWRGDVEARREFHANRRRTRGGQEVKNECSGHHHLDNLRAFGSRCW